MNEKELLQKIKEDADRVTPPDSLSGSYGAAAARADGEGFAGGSGRNASRIHSVCIR